MILANADLVRVAPAPGAPRLRGVWSKGRQIG